jgi:5-hydroxyisourate hydrolase
MTWTSSAHRKAVAVMGVTVYVHDSMRGTPAEGIPITLERQTNTKWDELGHGVTDDNGLVAAHLLKTGERGIYKLILDVDNYFVSIGMQSSYPSITFAFRASNGTDPLCLMFFIATHGYSGYRARVPVRSSD